MSALDKLRGQVLLMVLPESENHSLQFSGATLAVFAPIAGPALETLVGRSVARVHQVDGEFMEIQFLGGSSLRIDLTGPGPESYSLEFRGGPHIVV
jgi:hypothetical protein